MRLREPAPGKVNLCLLMGAVRADGRHELVTLFESVSLADELELMVLAEGPDQVDCPGVTGPNLAHAALAALRARGWDGPPVRIEISKRIPVAGGMGGGSADAAAALRLAAAVAPLPGGLDLHALASELGADVPSQLEPGLALGTGAGDVVEALAPLASHAFVIVPLDAQLSTAAVFGEADRLGLARTGSELGQRRRALAAALVEGATLPAELMVNDLEPAAISLCPGVGDALVAVREAGADHALVCGSGPTVAGLWWGSEGLTRARAAAGTLRGAVVAAVRHN